MVRCRCLRPHQGLIISCTILQDIFVGHWTAFPSSLVVFYDPHRPYVLLLIAYDEVLSSIGSDWLAIVSHLQILW